VKRTGGRRIGGTWIHRRPTLAREKPDWTFDSEAGQTVRAQNRGGASRMLRQLACKYFVCIRCHWADAMSIGGRTAEASGVDIAGCSLGIAARDDELHQCRWRVGTAARDVACVEYGTALMPLPNHVFACDSPKPFGPFCSKPHLPLMLC